jgi:hypothetical protein
MQKRQNHVPRANNPNPYLILLSNNLARGYFFLFLLPSAGCRLLPFCSGIFKPE